MLPIPIWKCNEFFHCYLLASFIVRVLFQISMIVAEKFRKLRYHNFLTVIESCLLK
jgi:hypothetical protein